MSELKVNLETIRMNFFMTKKQVQTNKEKIRDHQEILDKLKNQAQTPAPVPQMVTIPAGASVDMQQMA